MDAGWGQTIYGTKKATLFHRKNEVVVLQKNKTMYVHIMDVLNFKQNHPQWVWGEVSIALEFHGENEIRNSEKLKRGRNLYPI